MTTVAVKVVVEDELSAELDKFDTELAKLLAETRPFRRSLVLTRRWMCTKCCNWTDALAPGGPVSCQFCGLRAA